MQDKNAFLKMIAEQWAKPVVDTSWECDRDECDGLEHGVYQHRHARTKQREPKNPYHTWYVRAGRGFGKSKTGAETIVKWALAHPIDNAGNPTEWCIFAETIKDVRDICLKEVTRSLDRQGVKYNYNSTLSQVKIKDGALIFGTGADDDDVGRGSNLAGAWLDEVVKWRRPKTKFYEGILPAVRIAAPGWEPRIIVTTTPKPIDLLREWQNDTTGNVVMTVGSMMENKSNLSAAMVEGLQARYAGTRLERQELYGELIDDVEGALWTFESIASQRMLEPPDTIQRLVVAVDPAVTYTTTSDYTGLVVCGSNRVTNRQSDYYVLQDASLKAPPEQWARKAIGLYEQHKADCIVAEKNQGGEMVRSTIEAVARDMGVRPKIELVQATRGKALRAEPIAALYDLGRVKHCGDPDLLTELENQMTTWTPESKESPDRLDALVWGLTWLSNRNSARMGFAK